MFFFFLLLRLPFPGSWCARNCQGIDEPSGLLIHSLEVRWMCPHSMRCSLKFLLQSCHLKNTVPCLFFFFFACRKAVQVTEFMSFNSGLVVQYSNDNGILWHLLRELDFMSFLEPQIISIDLPREAKTPATAFRWWQPQHGKLLLTPPFLVALRA